MGLFGNPTATYDAAATAIVVDGLLVTGYAPDTFVEVEYNENKIERVVGAEGEVTRKRSTDRTGRIALTLTQASDFNSTLLEYAKSDRKDGSGVFSVSVKDDTGRVLHSSPLAWVREVPKFGYGVKAGTRAWIIETAEMDQDVLPKPFDLSVTGVLNAAADLFLGGFGPGG